jgi:anthraniloyl-CoA monooxygenase
VRLRRIDIIGGGPAGLFLGRLLKLHQPSWKVCVHERQSPHETFGFGVSFTRRTLRNIAVADPETHEALLATAYPIERSEFRTPSDTASVPLVGNIAIGRTVLLRLLLEQALAVGVQIETGKRIHMSELGDADVVVAADGVGSETRQDLADVLDVEVTSGKGLYLWCGASDVVLNGITFASVETEHGLFVIHAYPYSREYSTFLIETNEATWQHAGFAAAGAALPPGETDTVSLRYLEHAFCDLLGDTSLRGNRTQWLRFRTVHCQRWHYKNVVLIGDAAHTAHYSVGSGTKMAMEDAIALCGALRSDRSLSQAFEEYERTRRPVVEYLQACALRSQTWWESYDIRNHLLPAQLLVSYFTRMGTVRFSQLAETDSVTVTAAVAAFVKRPITPKHTSELVRQVFAEPFHKGTLSLSGRLLDSGWDNVPPAAIAAPCCEPLQGASSLLASRMSYVTVLSLADIAPTRRQYPGALLFGVIAPGSTAAWTPEGERLFNTCRHFLKGGCDGILLSSESSGDVGGERNALLSRLDLAERVCVELGGIVAVEGEPAYLDDLVAGIVAHRTHLVRLLPSPPLVRLAVDGDDEDL